MGERSSGTHFLEHAMQFNFAGLEYERKTKHFFGHHDEEDYEGSEDVLFLVLVRNPIEWLDSFFRQPYHVPYHLTRSWETFLKGEWYSLIDFEEKRYGEELMEDRCIGGGGRRYKNVLEMREVKSRYLLDELPKKVKNTMVIRYEDVRDDYGVVLKAIQERYGLVLAPEVEIKGEWRTVDRYKGTYREKYKRKEVSMPEEWRRWVWENLDEELEGRMGYYA